MSTVLFRIFIRTYIYYTRVRVFCKDTHFDRLMTENINYQYIQKEKKEEYLVGKG